MYNFMMLEKIKNSQKFSKKDPEYTRECAHSRVYGCVQTNIATIIKRSLGAKNAFRKHGNRV